MNSNYVAEIQSTSIPDEQLVSSVHICRRTHVDGYKLLVRNTCWLYLGDIITFHLCHGRLVSLCIQQQTGDKLTTILSPIYKKLVDGDKQVDTTCIRQHVSRCKCDIWWLLREKHIHNVHHSTPMSLIQRLHINIQTAQASSLWAVQFLFYRIVIFTTVNS